MAAVLLQLRIISIPFRFIGIFLSFAVVGVIFALQFSKDIRNDIESINGIVRQSKLQATEKFYEVLHYTKLTRYLGHIQKNLQKED